MTTDEIADTLKLTAQLMELHGENAFKARALANAAYKLDKTGLNLEGKTLEELEHIEGIGKSIASKIWELQTSGELGEFKSLLEKTPAGVIEMLSVKGIGPKKVAQLWKELGIESPGELLYACGENRLVSLKGFGAKTQESIKKSIEYSLSNRGKFHYATVEGTAFALVEFLKKQLKTEKVSLAGDIRRKSLIIEKIDVVVAAPQEKISLDTFSNPYQVPVNIICCGEDIFFDELFRASGTVEHLQQLGEIAGKGFPSEKDIYKKCGLCYIEPELREGAGEIQLARENRLTKLIEETDIRGILHNHSKWSDGMNTIAEMAGRCVEMKMEYFGICDHSKSAFYAGGLKTEQIPEQHKEIDALNAGYKNFRIFKGIESDILNDGSLDYENDVLATFDFIVASVHSVLKMDLERANTRLIKAIENPFTTILGHPTGRLLLSREGYPLDHKKIIDACAVNGVAIELNAHPHRLDIDWRWIPYCMEKGVLISINPDAHDVDSLADIHWGIAAARKGMLTKEFCLNTKNLKEITEWFRKKNSRMA